MVPPLLAGRYRRTRLLGRGAMGEVWLATDELLHRTVAIKSVVATGGDDDGSAGLDRVVREARLAAGLNHPNAVAVHDLVLDGGRPHVVMEYVDGRSLADEIHVTGGGLAADRVRSIGAAVADALARAHALGIVHRDVKPANILLAGGGVSKLADFGIARSSAAPPGTTTATGFMVGTPAFVAPEVVHGGPADARSDIWSLGATLYTALEGTSPFVRSGNDSVYAVLHRVVSEPVPPPRGDPATAAVVLSLLVVDPARRPTATQVAELLRRPPGAGSGDADPVGATGGGAHPAESRTAVVPVATPRRSAGARSPARRGRLVLAAAAVVVAVAAGAAVALVATGDDDRDRAVAASPSTAAPTPSTPVRSTPAPTTSAATTSRAATPSATYVAPGGISVRAPDGWIRDDEAGIVNIRDYREPGSDDRSSGTYFRIGISNPRPAETIADEGRNARQFLEGEDSPTPGRLVATSTTTFLGVPAVDQTYVGTNSDGVGRRFVLRLWIVDGHTLEIEVNAPTDRFDRFATLFDDLTASCTVS